MNDNWTKNLEKPEQEGGVKSRRDALQSMLGIGGLVTGGAMLGACAPKEAPAPAAPPRETLDFGDPAQSLRSFIKLTGDLNPNNETPGWFGGMVFGDTRRDRPLKPLFGIQGFGVNRIEPQEDGSYRVFNRELAFYTDPKTGKIIDKWKNPYTGEICDVKPIHNMTVNAHLIVSQKFGAAIEMDFDGHLMEVPLPLGWDVWPHNDRVFSTFEVHTAFPNELKVDEWPRESAGPVLRIAEIFQRAANLADLENPETTSTYFDGTWTRVGPWLPWMRMGQESGSLVFRTFMNKLEDVEQIPADLKAASRERFPDYFQAPPSSSWGSKNDSSFSVYARENEPLPPLPAKDE